MAPLDEKIEVRFWNKVNKGDGCWEWTGARSGPTRLRSTSWSEDYRRW